MICYLRMDLPANALHAVLMAFTQLVSIPMVCGAEVTGVVAILLLSTVSFLILESSEPSLPLRLIIVEMKKPICIIRNRDSDHFLYY